MKKLSFLLLVFLLVGMMFTTTGCWWDDDDDYTPTPAANLDVNASDGPIDGATVYVYSDFEMTKLLGEGTTDENGHVRVTLNTTTIPTMVYTKVVGGTFTEKVDGKEVTVKLEDRYPNGMKGIIAKEDIASKVYVTPLTNMLYEYVEDALAQDPTASVTEIYQEQLDPKKEESFAKAMGFTSEEAAIELVLNTDPTENTQVAKQVETLIQQAVAQLEIPVTLKKGIKYRLALAVFKSADLKGAGDALEPIKPSDSTKCKTAIDVFTKEALYELEFTYETDGTFTFDEDTVPTTWEVDAYTSSDNIIFTIEIYSSTTTHDESHLEGVVLLSSKIKAPGGDIAGHFKFHKWNGNAFTDSVDGGVFVGSIIPKTKASSDYVANLTNKFTSGSFVAREIYTAEATTSPYERAIIFADLAVEGITATGTTTADVGTATAGTTTAGSITVFYASQDYPGVDKETYDLVESCGKIVGTDLLAVYYKLTNGSGDGIFNDKHFIMVLSASQKKGIWAVSDDDNILACGDVEYTPNNPVSAFFTSETSYTVEVAAVRKSLIGQNRTDALTKMTSETTITTPTDLTALSYEWKNPTNPAGQEDTLWLYKHNILAILTDENGDFNDAATDISLLGAVDKTGAFAGLQLTGDEQSSDVNYQQTAVGKVLKVNTDAHTFSGKIYFLMHPVCISDADKEDYNIDSSDTGYISISADASGNLSAKYVSDGANGTLNVENKYGLLHIYGPLTITDEEGDEEIYVDIFWPIGGEKAVYYSSEKDDTTTDNYKVSETGVLEITKE